MIGDKTAPNDVISIEIPEVKKGEVLTVKYCGDLASQNHGNLYLHYGFDGWKGIHTVSMEKTGQNTYFTNIVINGKKEVNAAFKDDSNQWDNNHGRDYTIEI